MRTGMTTRTSTGMTTGMAEPATLLRLLAWCSPAFPTGGFAYSHGLEWAVEAGEVVDWAGVVDWVSALVTQGSLWSDCVLLRHAARAAGDGAALAGLAELGAALACSRERQEETCAQGAAFARATAAWAVLPDAWRRMAEAGWPLPVVAGAALRLAGVEEDEACLACLQAACANLVSAAVRLVPLGQSDGLRVLAALEPVMAGAAARSRSASLDELGGCCLAADIAAMRHETQVTRLFRT